MALPRDLTSPAQVLARLDEIEVVIEKLIAGGDGLARVEGVPLFVPRSVPGDRLRVRISERRPQYGRAEIVNVLEPGEGRREAPCPHFARCGGCDLQHIDDGLQGRLKAQAARETLRRLGRLDLPSSRLVEGPPFHYRTRAQLRIREIDGRPRLGYFARSSHDFVPIERCPVLAEPLEAALSTVAEGLPEGAPDRLDLAVGGDGDLTCAPVVEGLARGAVQRRVGGLTYSYDARTFFQVNESLLEDLVAQVCGRRSGGEAWDLYAGVGLFTLPLARRFERVRAIEGDSVSARFARRNARMNGVDNVELTARSIETSIQELPESLDLVVANPPRAGLSRRVSNLLLLRPPKELVYVSCHPASLARDLQILAPQLSLERLTFFDLFPQTGHLETVVELRAG